MKKLIFLALSLSVFTGVNAQLLSKGRANTDIKLSQPDTYTLDISFGDISLQQAEDKWLQLDVDQDHVQYLNLKDEPAMPFLGYSFLVDDDNIDVIIKNSTFKEYTGYDIVPAKGKISRKLDPSKIAVDAGPIYKENSFYPAQAVRVVNDYVVHDAHGKTIHVFPVQYNPVTHTLRVYSSLTLEVKAKVPTRPADASSNKIWNNIYSRHFVNYKLLAKPKRAAKGTAAADTVGFNSRMLIITDPMFVDSMQAFIKWKNQMGIRTWMVTTAQIPGGADADSIYAYIRHQYLLKNMDYVLLVGDNDLIPPRMDSGLCDTSVLYFAGASDIAYAYQSGADHYPDFFVGRFSADTYADLMPQLHKSVRYEKMPNMTQHWYSKAVGVASNLGPGDDNEMDWEHMRNIRTKLMGATYTAVAELYDSTHLIMDAAGDPVAQDLSNQIDSGVSLVNYCGHGWDQGIVTSNFQSTDITALNNYQGQWPFVVIVGCDVGSFVDNTCFAETFVRATDAQNRPIGAVADFMSTISQYWSEPMQAQDEINDIISGNSMDTLDNIGPIAEMGCYSMNDAYGQGGYDMTDTWTIFGDPSLQLRKQHPDTLHVTHVQTITTNTTSVNINVNLNDATVVLMHRDTLFSVRNVNNHITHHGFNNLTVGDSIMVSVTKANTTPYFGRIKVVAPIEVANVTAANTGITLYPNPSKNSIYLDGLQGNAAYNILDITGKVIATGSAANKLAIDISKLAQGSYIVDVQTETKTVSLPLQVLK